MALTQRDKIYTLIGILMALFLGALDQTIVSTALPKIVEDLKGLDRFAWVATSYLLASTVLVPVYGKLADMYSRKSIELWAVSLFLAGSFLCGIAGEFGHLPLLGDGMNQLIVFRALQGIGGAGLFSLAFIIIADLYPPNVRGRYQGLVGATFGLASVLGPWIGGLLTDYGSGIVPGVEGWRWVFYVNVPFGAVAIWFIVTRMPQLRPDDKRLPLDLLSASLLILGLVPLILALQLDKTLYPWASNVTLALFTAALIFILLFVTRSLRSFNPILDLSLFRNAVFSIANAAVFFLGATFMVIIIFLPLFMVNVVGVSATRAGVSLIPLSLGMVFGAIVSGQLVSFIGRYRLLMLVGGTILLVGVYLLSSMPVDVGYWRVTLYMVICGLGVGPSLPLYTLAIQNAVDVRKVGQATSSSQFFRQIGGTVGAAIMGTVLATSLAASFATTGQTGLGEIAGFSGRDFAASGGAGVGAQISQMFDQQYDGIAEAFRSGDTAALENVLAQSPLREETRRRISLGAHTVLGNEAASEGFLSELKQQLTSQAKHVTQEVEGSIRVAFNEAITSIYRYLIAVVVIGWSITWFVPVLPLRSTIEQQMSVANE
ncbi:MAG: MFS transporter [Trueperaceae bacterium]|nr:MAG: MFS transporter [Trueperaceae bacterium]